MDRITFIRDPRVRRYIAMRGGVAVAYVYGRVGLWTAHAIGADETLRREARTREGATLRVLHAAACLGGAG